MISLYHWFEINYKTVGMGTALGAIVGPIINYGLTKSFDDKDYNTDKIPEEIIKGSIFGTAAGLGVSHSNNSMKKKK